MSIRSSLRLSGSLVFSLALVTACSTGGDPSNTFTASNVTNVTSATQVTTTTDTLTDPTEATETETGDTDGTEDPTTEDPTTGEPTTDGPTTDDPTTGNPTTEDPTTGDPEQCGNGQLDPGEPCDGNNLGELSCQSLGYDNGQLSCDNCTIDDAGCSNGAQPGTGQYSHCLEAADCFGFMGSYGCVALVDDNMNPTDGVCTGIGCVSNANCPASPRWNGHPRV